MDFGTIAMNTVWRNKSLQSCFSIVTIESFREMGYYSENVGIILVY